MEKRLSVKERSWESRSPGLRSSISILTFQHPEEGSSTRLAGLNDYGFCGINLLTGSWQGRRCRTTKAALTSLRRNGARRSLAVIGSARQTDWSVMPGFPPAATWGRKGCRGANLTACGLQIMTATTRADIDRPIYADKDCDGCLYLKGKASASLSCVQQLSIPRSLLGCPSSGCNLSVQQLRVSEFSSSTVCRGNSFQQPAARKSKVCSYLASYTAIYLISSPLQ